MRFFKAASVSGGLLGLFLIPACNNEVRQSVKDIEIWPQVSSPVRDTDAVGKKVEDLLARMTVEEKVGQIMQAEIQAITPEEARIYHIGSILNGGGSTPHRKKNATAADWLAMADAFYKASVTPDGGAAIPIIWGTDAVHGHGNVIGATLFPHNIGLGAARNPELIRQIGVATASEVRATGIDWVFAPTLAVAQNDRWGRSYESYSEDPELVRVYAAAMVKGLQGEPGTQAFLSDQRVIATAKHFLADGGTAGGDDQGDARISERELVEIHNPGYPAAIEAGVQTVMASFSSWNGEKLHGHKYLLTDVLKGRMGFDGFVVGDWNGHGQLPGCTNASCPQAINAGIDLLMVTHDWKAMIENTLAQVRSGEISMARLDDAVRRILRVKVRAGLFDGKSPSERVGNRSAVGNSRHRALARQAVRESLVLLKNSNKLLPLSPRQTILVAGDGADNISKQAGGWSVTWQGTDTTNQDFPGATSIYKGISDAVESAGGKAVLSADGEYPADLKPDVAIVVYGEDPYAEGQGDITTLEFEPRLKNNLALLKKFTAQGIPTVSLFISGRPLWVNPELNASDAFVALWLPGSEGAGVADVIVADKDGNPRYDFKGRLSFSWPRTPLQEVLNPHHPNYDPLFRLGYGLTYASGEEGPTELLEDVDGVDAGSADDIPLYAGRPLEPWRVFITNHERSQILSGAFAALPEQDVVIRTSDKDTQEDALTVSWQNAQLAGLFFHQGRPLDLSRYLVEGAVVFDLKIDRPPTDELKLVMQCGSGCERELPLTETVRRGAGKGWRTVTVRLSCLARETDTFEQVTGPFSLQSSGKGQVSVANIRFVMNTETNVDCPD
ncbi:MAG TPA: exo 1,3/1,4-beta-D-glucan glucohydrolase [Gammaproteobacteria bacterium]